MRQRLEARQPEKAAGALDGVHQAENVIENFGVVRILLEPDQLDVDEIETLVGLRQEFPQQIVHETRPHRHDAAQERRFWSSPVSVQSV